MNKGLPRIREKWVEERNDTEILPDITSDYGRMRRDDKSLDSLRFPVQHKPRKAKRRRKSDTDALCKERHCDT